MTLGGGFMDTDATLDVMHVLIVDDDLDMCVALEHMFRRFDSKTLTYKIVNDPYDALLEMSTKEYDLLLVDANIPEISGIELLTAMDDFIQNDEALKSSNLYRKQVPVVLMSSSPTLLKKDLTLKHFQVQKKLLKKNLQAYLNEGSLTNESYQAN
jgi:CheY-like chemotaxis protein